VSRPDPALRFAAGLHRSRRWALAGLMLVIGGLSAGLGPAMVPDNALDVWFVEDDPGLQAYDAFQTTFGNDEVVLVMVDAGPDDPRGIFRPEIMRRIGTLSERLEAVDGVVRVHSILSIPDAEDTADGLAFERLLPSPLPEAPAGYEFARRRALDNPIYSGRVVDASGQRAMLWAQMAVMDDLDARRNAVVGSIRQVVKDFDDLSPATGGLGVIYADLNTWTERDVGIFIGALYLLMLGLTGWLFRSIPFAAAAVGAITLAFVGAMGLYGLLGGRVNMVTSVLPVVIMVLGVADAVHFPAAFVEVGAEGVPPGQRAVAALRRVLLPCAMTTVTTIAGFLALAASPMRVLRDLGVYTAVGLALALAGALVLMMVAFDRTDRKALTPRRSALVDGLLNGAGSLVRGHPRLVGAGLVAVTVAAAVGASQVRVDTYTLGYLPDDARVVQDHRRIEAGWGPYALLDYTIEPAAGRRAGDAEVVAATERFITEASNHPAISHGVGLPDLYRRMATVLGGPEAGRGELTPALVAQLDLVLSSLDLEWDRRDPAYNDNFLAPFRSEDGSVGRLTLISHFDSAVAVGALFDALDAIAERTFGGIATVAPAGYPPLYVSIIDHVMTSQVRSFFLALGVIFVLMLAWLRSLRLAVISLAPNLLPVLMMMGTMGAAGIDLDIGTASVAAVVIGVSVDDTIHFLYHWREAEARGLDWSDALTRTYERAGAAAVITTVLLVVGYSVMLLASVKTVIYFGVLTTVAAAAALAADLLLLPLLLRLWPARRGDADAR
jgi:predicted RND superfamily exporter protein